MFNGFTNITQPSLNGLQNIDADSISTTNLESDDIKTGKLEVNNINIGNQVETNKTNLTGITYAATPVPTTNISNKLIVSSIDATNTSVFRSNLNVLGTGTIFGTMQVDSTININGNFNSFGTTNKFNNSLNILGSLNTTGNSYFNNNLDVSGNFYVGKYSTTQTSSIDITGSMYIRDPSNPSVVYMKIYYEPTLYGFVFQSETPGRIMNFRVKDNAGNYKLFYFSAGQLYASMGVYFDNWFNVSFNNNFTLGDNNGSVYYGSRMSYVPSPGVTDGLVIVNKGLFNNTAYYTNFKNVDLTNTEVFVFRMNYNNIWSKVKHTFENGIDIAGNIIANSTTITPVQLSYVSGATSNIQTQLNNKLDLTTGGTLIGNIIANSTTITPIQLSYVSGTTSNIQTQLNNKLSLTGGVISGTLSITGTTTLNAQVNLNDILYVNTTTITPTQLSYLAGANANIQGQLDGKLNSIGTVLAGSLTFADTTIQSTAYTTVDDTKLSAIGTITTSTVAGNTNLTTGVIFSAGSMSLSAGTYLITINAYLNVITGTTTINGMAAQFSTSATAFTQTIGAQEDGGGFTWPVASGWSLNSTNPVVVTSTTVYYMLIRATFGTAARLRFQSANSAFTATRIG